MNNPNLHGRPGGAPYDRDREMDDRHRAMQQHDDMVRRDQEREREGDRYQSGGGGSGNIPIHQPVASRISGAIHSPGGLLANHNGSSSSMPLGGPPGPASSYGAPQGDHNRHQAAGPGAGSAQHQGYAPMTHSQPAQSNQQPPPSSGSAVFGGPLQGQQGADAQRQGQQSQGQGQGQGQGQPAGAQLPGGITQGQQPILNVSLGDAEVFRTA